MSCNKELICELGKLYTASTEDKWLGFTIKQLEKLITYNYDTILWNVSRCPDLYRKHAVGNRRSSRTFVRLTPKGYRYYLTLQNTYDIENKITLITFKNKVRARKIKRRELFRHIKEIIHE